MAKFKKPDDISFLSKLNAETYTQLDEVKRKDFKAPPNHI